MATQVGTFANNTLKGPANSYTNELVGDALNMKVGSKGGNDKLIGGADCYYNMLYGDAWTMTASQGGNDKLTAGENCVGNTLYGDAASMYDGSRGGNDVLTGAKGSQNFLCGDAFDMEAGTRGGADRLVSGANNTDHMWGDFREGAGTGGDDTFVFGRGNGIDYVYDFHRGEDTIELSGFGFPHISDRALESMRESTFLRFLERFMGVSIEKVDANHDGALDSVIHFDAHNSVSIYSVAKLTGADFDFA